MVHIYVADIRNLPDPKEYPEMLQYVSDERKNKTMKYLQAGDRKRCLGAGMMLEEILPRHGASPGTITLNSDGKPEAEGVYFNLSHSDDLVICAVGEKPVGCDIEKIVEEPKGVAERFFHQKEAEYLDSFEDEKRNEAFFRLWTLKESYLKMTGEGLHLPLDSFEILIEPEKVQVRRAGEILPCHIMEYTIPGYKLSVCAEEGQFAKCVKYIILAAPR